MKLLISLLFVSCVSAASAMTSDVSATTDNTQVESTLYPGGPGKGKKSRKGKRMNKKRKRACGKWAKRSYAG